MQSISLDELIRILQTAISPVALISGIGLIVLSMTNRFARTIDRARSLSEQIKENEQEEGQRIIKQIRILYQRSQILLVSISFALTSIFFASLLIISLFAIDILNVNLQDFIAVIFILSLICFMISLLFFIQDMSLSLKALKEELRDRI